MATDDMSPSSDLFFSTFKVTSQAFYKTPSSFALVNLKPILPGHVLVCPRRVVARHADLTPSELTDLYASVQKVGRAVEKAYDGHSLTISCQDGLEAGQSVPHVHVHVIPRRFSDFDGNNDEVYPVLETAEEELHRDLVAANNGKQQPKAEKFKVDADEDRPPRSLEEMEKEARWLEEVMKGID